MRRARRVRYLVLLSSPGGRERGAELPHDERARLSVERAPLCLLGNHAAGTSSTTFSKASSNRKPRSSHNLFARGSPRLTG